MVGMEMAMYNFHHCSMNNAKMGRTIKPMDQKNSKTREVIILAAPFVMSTTKI